MWKSLFPGSRERDDPAWTGILLGKPLLCTGTDAGNKKVKDQGWKAPRGKPHLESLWEKQGTLKRRGTGQFKAEMQSSAPSEAGSAGFPCRPCRAPLQLPGPAPVGQELHANLHPAFGASPRQTGETCPKPCGVGMISSAACHMLLSYIWAAQR